MNFTIFVNNVRIVYKYVNKRMFKMEMWHAANKTSNARISVALSLKSRENMQVESRT